MNPQELRKRADERMSVMEERRGQYEGWWRELSYYFAPNRGRFSVTDRPRKGLIRKVSRLRTIPDDFAAGIKSGLTSPSRPWFSLTMSDSMSNENERVKMWLNSVQDIMRAQMIKTNLYDQLFEVYKEQGIFGTACILIEEDDDDVFRARALTIGSYCIDADDRGQVCRLGRRFSFTVNQLAEKFGADNLPEELRQLLNEKSGNDRTLYEVRHLIQPSEDYRRGDGPAANFKYLSLWWLPGFGQPYFVRVGGYEERPFMVPRWRVIDGDMYGREQPGDMALDDAKTVQELETDERAAIKKGVRPPVMVAQSMLSGELNDTPGGVTLYNSMTGPTPILPLYGVTFDHQAAAAKRLELITALEETFYVNFFRMWTSDMRQGRTATEIQARESEKMYMLGPLIERQMSEILDPMIDRIYGIMLRAGMFPDPPEELQGLDVRVEYTSVLASVQKQTAQAGIDVLMNLINVIMQIQGATGQYPEVLDKVDFDEVVDQTADMYAIPAGIVYGDDVTAQRRAEREQAQAQQAQAQQAAAEAQSMAQAAPQMATAMQTASETQIGNGSVLDALTGVQ